MFPAPKNMVKTAKLTVHMFLFIDSDNNEFVESIVDLCMLTTILKEKSFNNLISRS